ncbi:hypothetical protein JX265_014050, partial [Neoarthrinium moseri]
MASIIGEPCRRMEVAAADILKRLGASHPRERAYAGEQVVATILRMVSFLSGQSYMESARARLLEELLRQDETGHHSRSRSEGNDISFEDDDDDSEDESDNDDEDEDENEDAGRGVHGVQHLPGISGRTRASLRPAGVGHSPIIQDVDEEQDTVMSSGFEEFATHSTDRGEEDSLFVDVGIVDVGIVDVGTGHKDRPADEPHREDNNEPCNVRLKQVAVMVPSAGRIVGTGRKGSVSQDTRSTRSSPSSEESHINRLAQSIGTDEWLNMLRVYRQGNPFTATSLADPRLSIADALSNLEQLEHSAVGRGLQRRSLLKNLRLQHDMMGEAHKEIPRSCNVFIDLMALARPDLNYGGSLKRADPEYRVQHKKLKNGVTFGKRWLQFDEAFGLGAFALVPAGSSYIMETLRDPQFTRLMVLLAGRTDELRQKSEAAASLLGLVPEAPEERLARK